jgi:hypothetical protein
MHCRVSEFRPDSLFQELILILEDGYFLGDPLSKAEITALCQKSHEPRCRWRTQTQEGSRRFTQMSAWRANQWGGPVVSQSILKDGVQTL